MIYTAAKSKTGRLLRDAARKARGAFLAALVAAGLVLPVLLAGLVAPPVHAATTAPHIVVNSTLDWDDLNTSDGVCDVSAATSQDCTLRAAIQEANARPGPDVIDFAIPAFLRDPTTGVATIAVDTLLPEIIDPVVVNGYSQPDSQVNTLARGTNAKPLIEITPTDQFHSAKDRGALTVSVSNVTVRGLVVNRFWGFMPGILVSPVASGLVMNDVRIEGNFIGTDPSGTLAEGNTGAGVEITGASGNTVGGTTLASRNLISGNEVGIAIRDGLYYGFSSPASGNLVRGNLIGTQRDAVKPLGNDDAGVVVADSAGILNGGVHDANGNTILSNSIFSNGALGIDLVGNNGAVVNDAGDADAGANRLQNKPAITSAKTVSGTTTVKGTLNSRPGEGYTAQFFSSPSGNEGRTFLGSKIVKTDGSGKASFIFSPRRRWRSGRG